jgi:iron complex outermembrane receptor protein
MCSTVLVGLASAEPVFAQTSPDSTKPDAAQEVVVTGSRIREPANFTSPDPIQVITSEQSTLRGLSDTTAILQQSTIAANATQINNNFSGFVVNGGSGVNTVNLRGLGADRTLVLIDGQRVGPAGVSGTVGSVDLNTIPSTMIDHVDILKDGSSSIYGSDAVAGVVNIVTKKNFDGGEMSAYARPFAVGGNAYDLSGSFGKTFDRGYVAIFGDYYEQDALRYGDRSYLNCAQDLATSPTTGARVDLPASNQAGYKCWNFPEAEILNAFTNYRYSNKDQALPGTPTKYDFGNLHRIYCTTVYDTATGLSCTRSKATDPIDVSATRLSRQELQDANPLQQHDTVVSPVMRYTVAGNFGYSIIPDRVEFYDSFLFNRRVSSQSFTGAIEPYVEPGNPGNPLTPIGGLLLPVVPYTIDFRQKVDYIRNLAGIKGNLPNIWTATNLHYDLSAQFSQSKGEERETVVRFDRVNAASAPGNCDPTYGGDNSYNGGPSMADLGDTAKCMNIAWGDDSLRNNGLTAAEAAYLLTTDVDRTTYEQGYVQGDISGDLFKLPAGPLGFDVGFHIRRDRINDVPGEQTLAGNSFGLSTAGVTAGSDWVKEGFLEVSVPVLKDLPFVKSLSFTFSGRISDYDSVGTAKTYKAAGVWAITDWLSLKYSQGTSFRAPQLFELFLADQTGYLSQTIDPCINYGASNNANIAANCAKAGIPSNYTAAGSVLVDTGGGLGNLSPETSLARNVGIVFRPKWWGLQLGLEVDYYENHIRNGIQQFGAGSILSQCYNTTAYPNGFCSLFTRDNNPTSPTYHNLLVVHDNYVNVADVKDRGIDATFYFRQNLWYGVKFQLDSNLSWTFQNSTQLLGDSSSIDYTGSVGAPAFVGNVNYKFEWRTWQVNWFTFMSGKASDARFFTPITNYRGTGQAVNVPVSVPFYAVHTLSIQKKFPSNLTLTAGISNLFDTKPPLYSYEGVENSLGTATLAGTQYDLEGRTGFIQLDKKF